jgi:hypothetical protein
VKKSLCRLHYGLQSHHIGRIGVAGPAGLRIGSFDLLVQGKAGQAPCLSAAEKHEQKG